MTYQPPGGPPPQQPPWQPQQAGAPYPASAYGGTPGYGYTPAAAQVKPLKGLSTAIGVLLAVVALAAIFLGATLVNRASLADDIGIGTVTFQELDDADNSVAASLFLFLAAVLAAGVVWIIWQFRYATNAQVMRGNYGLAPGWAIGGWFVPLGNYVLPQLQLFQAAKASDPDLSAGQPATAGRVPSSVVAWWVVYDLAWLMFAIGRLVRPSDNEFTSLDDIDRFVQADRISAFACAIYIVAAVIAIIMVRALTEAQTRAAASAAPYPSGYQQPPPQAGQWQQPPPQQWQQPPTAPAPPQTWAPPPPNQPWQPPPPNQPWQPPAPPPPQ